MDLFFMSLGTRKRIKTRLGLFFTSFEMRRGVRSGGPLFYEIGNKRASQDPAGSFFFLYKRAIMVGESFKGATYEDDMFN